MIRNQAHTGKQSQYGGSCPNCSERHSLDFGEIFITHEDRDHQIDKGNFYARRHVVCISCRATWNEVYDGNISCPDESAYGQKGDSYMMRPYEEGTLNVID